jgi:hypothetical protein
MIAVLIIPGQIAVARTPVAASSARIDKVMPRTAYFDAWYATTRAVGKKPSIEDRLTTWPRPRATIAGTK